MLVTLSENPAFSGVGKAMEYAGENGSHWKTPGGLRATRGGCWKALKNTGTWRWGLGSSEWARDSAHPRCSPVPWPSWSASATLDTGGTPLAGAVFQRRGRRGTPRLTQLL